MNKLVLALFITIFSLPLLAQRETFDITNYTPLMGWKKESTEHTVSFVTTNEVTRGWCRLSILKSMTSTGVPRTDFDTEWQQLVAGTYQGAVKPEPEQTQEDGWTSCSGVSTFQFEQKTAYLLLTSITGYGLRLSVLVLMNNEEFMPEVESFLGSIHLTKPTVPAVPPVVQPSSGTAVSTASGRPFAASITKATTNFNDGWVSTMAINMVVVTRGPVRVHLYFPLAYDDDSRRAGRDYFWDSRLGSEFQLLTKQYRDHGEMISSFQAPYIEGEAVDRQTNQRVFLGLYVNSAGGNMFPILAVAPDEQTLRNTFPKAENQFESDLAAMSGYNKFAVTLRDLHGKWTGGGTTAANYYNAYTGNYAGMGAVAMSDRFEFMVNGDYTSRHQGASGMVGSMSTYSQDYKGKATVSDWNAVLTNRFKGATTNFNAWFEAVQGGVVLHLQDAQYSGSRFDLVRER